MISERSPVRQAYGPTRHVVASSLARGGVPRLLIHRCRYGWGPSHRNWQNGRFSTGPRRSFPHVPYARGRFINRSLRLDVVEAHEGSQRTYPRREPCRTVRGVEATTSRPSRSSLAATSGLFTRLPHLMYFADNVCRRTRRHHQAVDRVDFHVGIAELSEVGMSGNFAERSSDAIARARVPAWSNDDVQRRRNSASASSTPHWRMPCSWGRCRITHVNHVEAGILREERECRDAVRPMPPEE